MAQTQTVRQNSMPRKFVEVSNLNVAVPQAGLTLIASMQIEGCERAAFEIIVAGQALDAFEVHAKCSSTGNDIVLANAALDFTSPSKSIFDTSGDLTSQAVGTGWVIVNTHCFYEVSLYASSGNVAGSTVSVHASAN